jgi:hypothetical protein
MLKHNGSTLFRHTKGGVLERVEHTVKLSMLEGHYYHEDTPEGRRNVISARGWELIAAIAGIGFHKPSRVCDEQGVEVDNPIIRRRGSSVEFVRIREMLIARGANGNLRALDLTLSYSVASALSSKLMDAWMDWNQQEWGWVANDSGAEMDLMENRRLGKVDIGGGNCFVYNLAATPVLKILREHNNWSMMADRAAATIVERNLMRRFFGATDCDENGVFTCHSWVGADIDWNAIKIKDGLVVVDGDKLSLESAEEETEEIVSEDGMEGHKNLLPFIRAEADRVGGWRKARDITKATCEKHNLKWGDLGATENREALVDILSVLRQN